MVIRLYGHTIKRLNGCFMRAYFGLRGCAAHDSGGVKADIVVPSQGEDAVGFLAKSKEEYAEAILRVVGMGEEERRKMAEKARRRASNFSESEFAAAGKLALRPLLRKLRL